MGTVITNYLKLSDSLKIAWTREYLMSGLRRLTQREFSDKELINFFNFAQKERYDLIKKKVRR